MTAAAVCWLHYKRGVDFPRVIWVFVWIDIAITLLGAPRDIAWLIARLS